MCPGDSFADAGTVCRSAAGVCDRDELCTGQSTSCPVDALQPTTVVCRPAAGTCDAPESCTGSATGCPVDTFLPATSTACAPARCSGFAAACLGLTCTDNNGCAPDTRSACVNGTCRTSKFVFLTSTTHASNFGGLPPATAICNALAADAGLTGSYDPWISTAASSPRARFNGAITAFMLRDKTVIAAGTPDLYDGQIIAPINRDERGVLVTTNLSVISGTNPQGTPNSANQALGSCSNWTSNSASAFGAYGAANTFGQGWTVSATPTCASQTAARLYCFEQ